MNLPSEMRVTDSLEEIIQLAESHEYWRAIDLGRARLAGHPDDAALHALLGRCLLAAGDGRTAYAHLQRALTLRPDDAEALRLFGDCLARAGQLARAVQSYDEALRVAPNMIAALTGKAMAMIGLRRLDEAAPLLERAGDLAQDDADTARGRRLLHAHQVPRWHFPMVNEVRRNAAFEKAIRAAVGPGDLVLDIGAGSGLLSLIAARAGAERVIACEVNRPLAAVAREIVARNGFSERVEIIAKASQLLDPKVDLPRPADVLVAEVLDSAVLGEGALETIEHARHHLLAPGARIIPARARIRAALVESLPLWQQGGVENALGFDLTPLNRFQPELIGIEDRRYPLTRLSEDRELIAFDFTGTEPVPSAVRQTIEVTHTGTAHALIYWMAVDLDAATTLDNRPDLGDGGRQEPFEHWGAFARIINPPRPVAPGDTVNVAVHHDRQFLEVLLADPGPLFAS